MLMTKKIYLLILLLPSIFMGANAFSQTPPWNNPLKMAWSTNGITFDEPKIFQDSAGVPSVVKWKGDTLIAVFQWFRLPNPSKTWDRVAVKFSYNNGLTWTHPLPIVVNGLPSNYQRPFDPTLAVISKDSLRIYFSSSKGVPMGGLDSTVNTYSAKSTDGINYYFEANPRVDQIANRLIDPAVIYFNASWHYSSPIGSPQQGAYHYISPDGFKFSPTENILSDNTHNWTGNYMVESNNELRFYGSGRNIWYNHSPNGNTWAGYVNTNIQGGDPSVLKVSPNNYLMIYVGQPYITSVSENVTNQTEAHLFPNPTKDNLNIILDFNSMETNYTIYDYLGRVVHTGKITSAHTTIDLKNLPMGIYWLCINGKTTQTSIILKQ